MKNELLSETQEAYTLNPDKNFNTNRIEVSAAYSQVALYKAEEIVEEIADAASEQNPLTVWMESIAPVLKQGGKPVAIILALGATSIPLMLLGGGLVAYILATGACIVAIRASL